MVVAQTLPVTQQQLCGVTGHCMPLKGPVEVCVRVGSVEEKLPVYVADMEEPCLLGLDYLTQSEACVDLGRRLLKVRGVNVPLLPMDAGEKGENCVQCKLSGKERLPEGHENEKSADVGLLPEHLWDLAKRSTSCLTEEQAKKTLKALAQYADVFSRGDMDLGRTALVKHSVNTGNSSPVKQAPRRVAPAKREEMQQAVESMAALGLIERSDSPWSSPVVLVEKKDGTKRFCVDYRALNGVTVKDSYPLPRIDDTLDALTGAEWFSTLDLKSGYHQVEMEEEDKRKTAFTFGQGLWHFNVMPFGLCNAPGCFERLMEKVLEGMQWKKALVYLDDVIVFGRTFEEELGRLEEVLQRLRDANLKLSPKKCLFFQHEVPFLGHIVGKDGVRTDPLKVTAVKEWPVPTSVAEVRSFVGLCTYYRRFVKGFASVAAPLHQLTRKGAHFQWNEACQHAFEDLKQALMEAPVLPYPDPGNRYLLDTDASAEGVGAVLSQVREGQEHVIAYYSAKFSQPERNYCVTRKELLAVVKSLEHFHSYLYGAEFTIRTDHAALRWLKTLKVPEGQLARWLGRLEQYNYHVEHRPGRVHINADSLSRRPCLPDCNHCARRDPDPVCRRLFVAQDLQEADNKWRKSQREDSDLTPVIRWLEAGPERPNWEEVAAESTTTKCLEEQWETLRLDRGILSKHWVSTGESSTGMWLVVVPRALRAELLQEVHAGLTSGHQGVKKTLSRLRRRFYWIGMRKDVEEWCRACDVCSAKKGPARRTRAPLQLYQVGAPMERVAVDIAGPFPLTSRGNRFICVIMDYFTKWPEAYALPNHEAGTVAEVLVDQFFTRFGVPRELHSDQGREFESRVFHECCELLGIHKTRTTPLRPQSDGMVERFNRTLADELAKYCDESQRDWDIKLPVLLMAYRSGVHEATGYTPACLMLGRELRLPVDLATGRPPDEELPTVTTGYATALQERLDKAGRQVRSNLQLVGQAMRQRYNQRVREARYAVGDRVWLYNPRRKRGLSPKLQSSWEGPYHVQEVMSDVTYRIRRGQNRSRVVHVDRLWRYFGPGHYSWGNGQGEETVESGEDEDLEDVEEEEETPDEEEVEMWENGAIQVGDSPDPEQRPCRNRRRPGWLADFVVEDED
ncbi:hypothetical protein Pmani_007956 [Petrolisthes manimaculis]|uniref:RNA-directed DNA polymerase n=1 Tax=Petrolisthes manimaculis TaxID=1843537 RepID=A0AAE1PL38_9EUCA|nr:hypothetical protein Pmani_019102 [Petrolisthes manimaculis]KAK4321231.1 hypothetical protein Pmani_007956 [Petrolisthes manimaculis]